VPDALLPDVGGSGRRKQVMLQENSAGNRGPITSGAGQTRDGGFGWLVGPYVVCMRTGQGVVFVYDQVSDGSEKVK
jgi:hypothetical protein